MTLANGYKRVYHYHLKKCGGTSMNAWLASQFPDHRVWNPNWTVAFAEFFWTGLKAPQNIVNLSEDFAARARNAFRWSEAICDHAPLKPYTPSDTFCFTVLRRPIDRIMSQVADWRRLDPSTYQHLSLGTREAFADARALSLEAFLSKYAKKMPPVFDNYLVRALAAARLGLNIVDRHDLSELEHIAMLALDVDFDLVGVTDRQRETKAMIANALGFAPEPSFPRLNVTESDTLLLEEREPASDILAELTCSDQRLYTRAKQIFEERFASAIAYDEARFEQLHVTASTDRLDASELNGSTAFSVQGPIIGSGFHPRDSAGHSNCRVWSGPGTRSVLYMPAPAGRPLRVKVWVHGYAGERQRDQLRIEIDDRSVSHRFEHVEGWREVILVDAVPTRPWIKLAMILDETLTSDMAGVDGNDNRLRGISFDRYGWEAVSTRPRSAVTPLHSGG